jgi:hypothetical protein
MDDGTSDEGGPEESARPAQHVYFVTVTWLDEPHAPESPERLAQVLRHALEHAHRAGADAAPARFVVRVKAGDVAAEAVGTVAPHHHHHQPE